EHLRRWMGPRRLEMSVCDVDLRVGGKYRFVYRTPDGQELEFHGEFLEVVRPERIVRTFIFPPMEAHETLTLEEHGGRTIVHTTSRHKTFAGRDGHLSGADGAAESYERLDELLSEIGRS